MQCTACHTIRACAPIRAQATVSALRRAGLVLLNAGPHYSPEKLDLEPQIFPRQIADPQIVEPNIVEPQMVEPQITSRSAADATPLRGAVGAEFALRAFTRDALALHAALVDAGLPSAAHRRFSSASQSGGAELSPPVGRRHRRPLALPLSERLRPRLCRFVR